MAPKCGLGNGGNCGPAKRPKRNKSPTASPSPPASPTVVSVVKIEVPWELPRQDKESTQSDQGEAITIYSPTLYNQPWRAITTLQSFFLFPPYRTLIYRNKRKDLVAGNSNQSTAAFRDLFHAIKHDTERKADGNEGTYARDIFDQNLWMQSSMVLQSLCHTVQKTQSST
jgi:hypothetical protein